MYRTLLILWLAPIVLMGIWAGLAANDVNFGYQFFSRAFYDHILNIYGHLLGVDPQIIPGMVIKAIIFDSAVIIPLVIAFRMRARWWPQTKRLAKERIASWIAAARPASRRSTPAG
ncbi:MAG: DUF6105 family protein [Pseudomonadota bacterium]